MIQFGSPDFFWLYLSTPALIGFFLWAYQKRKSALGAFADSTLLPRLSPDHRAARQTLKRVLFMVFFLIMVFALARPRFGVKMEMTERRGVDVMVALDISKSMLAEDITPNRIDRAKHEIGKLIDLLKGDRVGIVVFAGESFVQCPLTLDYGAAKMFLNAVQTDWVQLQGTALADAISQSTDAYKSESKKHKVMILLSDGEDHEGDAVEAAREASEKGVRIYTVGIGSESGVPIPVRKSAGQVSYKKDRSGNLVMTRLNPVVLEKIALETGGKYYHAGINLDLSRIYGEIAQMEEKDLGMNKAALYQEQYQLFLLLGLFFLLVEFFIPERVKRKKTWRGRFE